MALEDMKIKDKDFIGKDVASLPVHPSAEGMSASALQAAFDRAVKAVVVPKFNGFLDELPQLVTLLGRDRLTSEDFMHVADGQKTGFTVSALLELARNHWANTANPHQVTQVQVGLDKVDNTADLDKPVSRAVQAELDKRATKEEARAEAEKAAGNLYHKEVKPMDAYLVKVDGRVDGLDQRLKDHIRQGEVDRAGIDGRFSDLGEEMSGVQDQLRRHQAGLDNPHQVTKAQVGLDQVDNTADLDKPVSRAVRDALDKNTDRIKQIEENFQAMGEGVTDAINDGINRLDREIYALEDRVRENEQAIKALQKGLPKVMAKSAYGALTDKDPAVVYILTEG